MMFNIKTLAIAAAITAGGVLAMPGTGQAMPQSSPAKIDNAKNGNIVDVRSKKRWKKWSRYCRYSDDSRCYKRRSARHQRYRYYDRYDEPYYGYYRPRYREPGIGLQLRID